jgi:hypothetical protein
VLTIGILLKKYIMSKSTKKYAWLQAKPNSGKTLIEPAKQEVLGFSERNV